MKRHSQQAQQLYAALKARSQTWTRNGSTLTVWANEFAELENDVGSRQRIAKVLNWYCNEGCGALFVPLLGTAQTFREKFEQLDKARVRLKGQPLRYFDDVIEYQLTPRITGSVAQREYAECTQKLQQRIEYVDDLAHGRVKLPPVKLPPGGNFNGKLTAKEKALLKQFVIVSRDTIFNLMMQNPVNQRGWHERLESSGFWKRVRKYTNVNRGLHSRSEP